MTPNMSDRLDSIIQAMSDVILPAIDSQQSLAREQAGLVMAHLNMIRAQLPLVDSFEHVELNAAKALASSLIPLARGGAQTSATRAQLEALMQQSAATTSVDRQTSLAALNAAMEDLVRHSRVDGEAGAAAHIAAQVLIATQQSAQRNRIWFNGSGFDAQQDELPLRRTLLSDGAGEGGATGDVV
ncbi:MAG: hypothetical protein AB7E24_06470 [Novosphingobium sp.]